MADFVTKITNWYLRHQEVAEITIDWDSESWVLDLVQPVQLWEAFFFSHFHPSSLSKL